MIDLQGELTAAERAVLAVDTSDLARASELSYMAKSVGAHTVKLGLELASADDSSWAVCSGIAADAELDWVADTKADDIATTVGGFMRNIVRLEHPPVAITMHTHSGVESMKKAQEIAGEAGIMVLGVTELTSVKEPELRQQLADVLAHFDMELPAGVTSRSSEINIVRNAIVHMRAKNAARAGLGGLVASPKEIKYPIKSDTTLRDKFLMIPGARSKGADTHDQQNVETPYQAIVDGADLLVIGRQVTQSKDPKKAFQDVVEEIQKGLDERSAR